MKPVTESDSVADALERVAAKSLPHATLRRGPNVVMILAWGGAAFVFSSLCDSQPMLLIGIAAALGAAGGWMQLLGFRQNHEAIAAAQSAREVRARPRETRWGKRHSYFLPFGGGLLVMLAFALSANPALAFPAAYFSMMFTRELVTFRATWELGARVPAGEPRRES